MLGSRLKLLRKNANKTQEDLATYLGITRGAYSHFENDRNEPDNEMLSKLAEYFNVSADYLLGNTDYRGTIGIDPELAKVIASRISDLLAGERTAPLSLSGKCNHFGDVVAQIRVNDYVPDIGMVAEIADYFNVSLDYMYGLTDDPTPINAADPNRPYTIDDWPVFLAQLPEDQAMHYQGVEYSDDQKLKIMELARKARQKKQAKINKLLEYPDEVIDDALIYAAFDLEKRKKMNEED